MNAARPAFGIFVAGGQVTATPQTSDGWEVKLSFGVVNGPSGQWVRYMTPATARELAGALVAAADYYDAETALVGGGAV